MSELGRIHPRVERLARTLAAERGHEWFDLTPAERDLYRQDALNRVAARRSAARLARDIEGEED